MVSDGQAFKLWIPPKNKFVVGPSSTMQSDAGSSNPGTSNPGTNDAGSGNLGTNNANSNPPEKRLENMRPQYIYDALLIPAINSDEIAVLENGYETVLDSKKHRVEQPDYRLLVVRKGPNGNYLSRTIEFSRIDLRPYRQMIYDEQGNVATDAHYQTYNDFSGSTFPETIEIDRPRENYDLTLNMVKLEINKALTDDQFILEQPAGAEVVHLGQSNSRTQKRRIALPSKSKFVPLKIVEKIIVENNDESHDRREPGASATALDDQRCSRGA